MKLILRSIFNIVQGKLRYQRVFQILYKIGVKGMNYGNGGNAAASGEIDVIQRISNFYKHTNDIIIFDVGANIGQYSLLLFDVFSVQGHIHAFEPSASTFQLLVNNTKHIPGIVHLNKGVSEVLENTTLYSDYENSVIASLYQRDLAFIDITMNKTEVISLTTIDAYCEENNIFHLHFLKLDIEGHEMSALKGAARMIASGSIDFIQFEFGGCNIDSRTFFKDFYNLLYHRFTIYRIVKDGLMELNAYGEDLEIFSAVNFLAKRKELDLI